MLDSIFDIILQRISDLLKSINVKNGLVADK